MGFYEHTNGCPGKAAGGSTRCVAQLTVMPGPLMALGQPSPAAYCYWDTGHIGLLTVIIRRAFASSKTAAGAGPQSLPR